MPRLAGVAEMNMQLCEGWGSMFKVRYSAILGVSSTDTYLEFIPAFLYL